MKRVLALLLALVLLLSLPACGTSTDIDNQALLAAKEEYQNRISALEEENEQLKTKNAELESKAAAEFDAGYEKGVQEGEASGYATGYQEAYSQSYQEGYDAGCSDTKRSYESTNTASSYTPAPPSSSTSDSTSYTWLTAQDSTPEPEPDPEPVQQLPASTSYTVYITKSGTKYHSSSCSYLKNSKISISKDDAVAQGYTACSRCKP